MAPLKGEPIIYANASDRLIHLLGGQKSHRGVGDSALKRGWITPVICQFAVLLSPILVLVLCSMFFDQFDPLITSLILPTNSLALFLVQKLRERLFQHVTRNDPFADSGSSLLLDRIQQLLKVFH